MSHVEPENSQSFPDIQAISRQACDDLVELSREAIQAQGAFRLSLSGGSTPKLLYELMAERRDELNWDKIYLYWGDERNVPHDHVDSNYRMVKEAMLDHVPIPESNVFPVPINTDDPAATASEYEAIIKESFGNTAELRWDLVLLGMGDDAHTASLFPETKAIGQEDRLFVENWVEKFDAFRLTLTAPAINSAKNIWFMIGGAGKREAIHKVWGNEQNVSLYPSQLIAPTDGTLRWMLTDDVLGE